MSRELNKFELGSRVSRFTNKEKALLRLIFVDNIPKTTLMWLYQIRYRTLQDKLKNLFGELK